MYAIRSYYARQVLSLGDAIAIIVGLIIGAGIFKAPSTVAGASGSEIAMVDSNFDAHGVLRYYLP